MRKSAPALIFTTLIAFASGSALALGDRAKEKKANTDAATTSTAPSSTYTAPPSGTNGSAAVNGSGSAAIAQADPRCDESKYATRAAMPKECLEKQATGSAGSSAKPGLSGGATSPGGPAGSASGASASGASSSSSSAGGSK